MWFVSAYRSAKMRCSKRPVLVCVLLVVSAVVVPLIYQILYEFVRIGSVTSLLLYLEPRAYRLIPGMLVLSLLYLALGVATRRLWIPCLVEGLVLFVASCANLFKLQYRDEPIVPQDMRTLGEAVQVGSNLRLSPTREMFCFLLAILVLTAALGLFALPKAARWQTALLRVLAGLLFVPLAWLHIYYVMPSSAFANAFGLLLSVAGTATSAYINTGVTNFFFMAAQLNVPAPEDYSRSTMEAVLAQAQEYASADGRDADVIVILLESYFHIPADSSITLSEPLTENYDRLAAEGVSGTMLSDGYGGGTANIEFCVDTGFCYSLLPQGSIPFSEYVSSHFPSYAQYLLGRNYRTASLHAYYPYFYNRENAYPRMGIQESYWMDSFVDPYTPSDYISDIASADRLIELYDEMVTESPDQSLYLKCVTMQNHCEYLPGAYTGSDPVQVSCDQLSEYDLACLQTMVSNLRDVDLAIGQLCDYFSTVDRDVVIVFYGDHQSDCGEYVFSNVVYGNLSGDEKTLAMHSTPFLLWSNFSQPGTHIDGYLSTYQLVPLATQQYGVTRPLYFDFLNEMRNSVAGYACGYCLDGSGQPVEAWTEEQQAWMHQMELIQYDAIFGKRYITDALFGLSA